MLSILWTSFIIHTKNSIHSYMYGLIRHIGARYIHRDSLRTQGLIRDTYALVIYIGTHYVHRDALYT